MVLFEVVEHRGWAVPLALLLPLAGRHLPLLRHPVPPLLVLVAFAVFPDTNEQAAPGFTLGLTWLAHVALRWAARRADAGSSPG